MSSPGEGGLTIETVKKGRISWIWIIPAISALLGLSAAIRHFSEQGPLVELQYNSGNGIVIGKTQVKYKGVPVGLVEAIAFDEKLEKVIVKARLNKEVSGYLGETTNFSLITAKIRGTNFQGLSTLLSGPYISMDWSTKTPKRSKKKRFVGLEQPPLTPPGAQGSRITLYSPQAGSVGVGSPILYRNMEVGRVESFDFSADLKRIEHIAFVNAPYDQLLGATTRFWDVSGLRVEAGSDGLKVELASVNTLLSGGVSFGNIVDAETAPLDPDKLVFAIYDDEKAAKESQYDAVAGDGYLFLSYFPTVEGVSVGSAVTWEGIRIGTVRDVVADVTRATEKAGLYVVYELQPARLGLNDMAPAELRKGLEDWIGNGVRAQLNVNSILSGRKSVRLVKTDNTDGLSLDLANRPYPSIPTSGSDVTQVSQNVADITDEIAALPLDDLVDSAVRLLRNADRLIANPETQQLPAELGAMVASMNQLTDGIGASVEDLPQLIASLEKMADAGEMALVGLSPESEVYVELSLALRDLREASQSLSALARRLEMQPDAIIKGR